MKPKKYLGQNFLRDANILRKEVGIGEVGGRTVLEIGAGDGRLTEKIVEGGALKVLAVEKDKELAAVLKEKFGGNQRVAVINADFLEVEPHDIGDENGSIDIVIGNIPYYISSAIIFRLKDYEFERAVLIVQKEFAEKMVAKPNESNYGRLSVTAQLAFEIELVQKVPRHLFSPAPKVDSMMIILRKTKSGTKITKHEEEIIRILFQHKNQSVRNALKHAHAELVAPEEFAKRRVRTLTKGECLEIAKSG
ncbi:TPA: ribosomal RNA small subunit methyltransferase A [Candidatus Micrarchaeota archaeon]|nr:ribosomal RNA small subunit methyltransferase A [Candidatus Micrarchaeota archaeon]